MEHISVQLGDVIGIFLPRRNALDIVSDTSDEELFDGADSLLYRDSDDDIPGNIGNVNSLQEVQHRIAHLYAYISSK